VSFGGVKAFQNKKKNLSLKTFIILNTNYYILKCSGQFLHSNGNFIKKHFVENQKPQGLKGGPGSIRG
jgi:hypothetical protein